jgi:sugar lactone lactonase YvrE
MMYDYETARGRAALYRLDDGPQVTMVRRGVTLGNGLGWSPDSKQMYFIDSTTQTVVAIGYDPATGQLGADRILCTIPVADGLPDGLCVDDSGAVWVALFGGSAIHRFSADGDLDTVVQLPVSQVTSCAFGGAGGATLYITSARRGLGPAALTEQPHAGAVFALDPGVTGPAATGWRPVAGAPVA